MSLEDACLHCRAGLHDECRLSWLGELEGDQACCCKGEYTLAAHYALMAAQERTGAGSAAKSKALMPAGAAEEKLRGDSGYIHPDAWPSPRDIGTLAEPESTGRKRMVKMYPIETGMVCEWARLKHAGGGVKPIIGCLNNPATDLHHGPDKNTLNNAKMSRGVGDTENIHIICSECHNSHHAANDPYYPPYDRVLEQASPWLPVTDQEWGPQDSSEQASFEELVAEEQRREERRIRRGRANRGRNATARTEPNLDIEDD